MSELLDAAWLARHPLPDPGDESSKNSRGRLLAVGGSMLCPGGLLLTAEAALHAGAGKVKMATIAPAALPLGIAMPEAGVRALPVDDGGEIAASAAEMLADDVDGFNAVVLGPAMADPAAAGRLLAGLLPRLGDRPVLFDAAAIGALRHRASAVRALKNGAVLTPHHGEMAHLCGMTADAVAASPETHAIGFAERFGAIIVLKAGDTLVAAPDGRLLRYTGGGVGLATSGSGDVLAGTIGGLLARGADPLIAAAWGVWLHGEAGRQLGEARPIGFLARELLPLIPTLMTG
jgi:hydroxyethylthiazole kinase-like uncharacterized protein yjeF